ncbi:MAG: rhomboid family intramembrane serine protease [Cytophagaceae bacterium]|nr:rhomboid family intramembrane serine protease [Cytophagaceae bacterium]
MAFGISPKHIQDIPLKQYSTEQFLVLALETAKQLKWNIGDTSTTGFVAYTNFSMSSMSEEVTLHIANGQAILKSKCTGNQMMDWGKNKRNTEDFVAAFQHVKNSYTTEELERKYEELKPTFLSEEEALQKRKAQTPKEKIGSFFSIFIPIEGYFITPILVNLNILIFILMVSTGVDFMSPANESLILWGANFRPITLAGEGWRLITCCFLHIGILHLLMNMYALVYIGVMLEPHLGKTRYATAYLLTGITGSLASLWWHDYTISAGASGAIFGMYGLFLAMLTTNLIEKAERNAILPSIGLFVGYNLLNGVRGNIDNAAHIGGLLGGIIIGYAMIPSLKKPGQQTLNYLTISALTVFILASSFVVYKTIPNDIATYDVGIKEFIANESKALEVYSLPPNTPDETYMQGLKEGIAGWKKNIQLIDSFSSMDLPAAMVAKNILLKQYCELRVKSYELQYLSVAENTNQYQEELEGYNGEIEVLIKQLGGEQEEDK